jgi:hypothetical protein
VITDESYALVAGFLDADQQQKFLARACVADAHEQIEACWLRVGSWMSLLSCFGGVSWDAMPG